MSTFSRQMQGFLGKAVDVVLPPRCVVSGDIVEQQGMLASQAWAALDFITDPVCAHCGVPFDFAIEQDTQDSECTSCLTHPPSFDLARAALRYNDKSRDIILGFKHADKLHVVSSFVPWLKRAVGAEVLAETDYIIPVPLHRWRLLSRRYNQAAIMAKALARDIEKPWLPMALERVRATKTQGHLSFKERRKNVRRAFTVNPEYQSLVKGRNILLIDDVYTTGSTAEECTTALKTSGAAQVNVLTLARVVKGHT